MRLASGTSQLYGDLIQLEKKSPEAIKIATLNGATFLGIAERAGSIEVGKQADLVVFAGEPAKQVSDIREVHTGYRRGKGFNPKKMMDDVRGVVDLRDE